MIAIDFETFLFRPGCMAPKVICLTTSEGDIYHRDDPQCKKKFLDAISGTVIGQNIAYDMACAMATWPDVIPAVFEAYDNKRVRDTQIKSLLYRISTGQLKKFKSYSLKALAKRWLDEDLEKGRVRVTFHLYDDVPIEQWPKEYTEYAIKDSVITAQLWHAIPDVVDEDMQCRAAFALHLMGIWGIRTDLAATFEYENELKQEYERIYGDISHFFKGKFVKGKPSKNMTVIKAAVTESFNGDPPLTDKGAVKTDKYTLEASGHPDLLDLREFQKISTYVNTYIPLLKQRIIHVQYGLAETGRTTASPNIQNQPRKGMVRQCYIPRPGYYFCSCDYNQIEMCSLAQVLLWLFGESVLADKINNDIDTHLWVTSIIKGLEYDETLKLYKEKDPTIKQFRQVSKVANFGYPGGMCKPETFSEYARGYGVHITVEESAALRPQWLRAWDPDMEQYFEFMKNGVNNEPVINQFISKRVRGDVRFTQACNSLFQGLTADGAKAALYAVQKACYNDSTSPLYRSRPVAFIHDELLVEVPQDKAHEAAECLSSIMISEMKEYLPDISVKAEPALMERWHKDAEAVYDKEGRLILWVQ